MMSAFVIDLAVYTFGNNVGSIFPNITILKFKLLFFSSAAHSKGLQQFWFLVGSDSSLGSDAEGTI